MSGFQVGDLVEVTDHYSWCGEDVYGERGEVIEVHPYPADIVEGGAIYSVRRPGRISIPLTAAQLRRDETAA